MATQNAVAVRITDKVQQQVEKMVSGGRLQLPPGYSPQNALASAWLELQNVEDKNRQPVLKVCDEKSITRALLYMAYQGLNPSKGQCFFIAHGKQLTLRPSVFGNMMIAKRVNPHIVRFEAYLVYEDEEVITEIIHGVETVVSHKRNPFAKRKGADFEGLDPSCVGAYCNIIFDDGHWESDIMTISEIRRAWKVGNAMLTSKAHKHRPEEMVKRTVINHACKPIIRSSDDSSLLGIAIRATEQDAQRAETAQMVHDRTNVVDVDFETVEPEPAAADEQNPEEELSNLEPDEGIAVQVDIETGEVLEPAAADGPGF